MVKIHRGFPGNSAGKESPCNSGDPGSIPGSGRSPGEGIGYPLQFSWASLEAQMVKNPPAMWEIWFWSLGWEDPLEEGMATHSTILAWRIPWTEEPCGYSQWGHKELDTTEQLNTAQQTGCVTEPWSMRNKQKWYVHLPYHSFRKKLESSLPLIPFPLAGR